MIDSKDTKKIANKLEEIALRNINKAIKTVTNGKKVTRITDRVLREIDTKSMSDNEHMLYECAFETLYIIYNDGNE